MLWKNSHYSVATLLNKYPVPDSWKFDSEGKVIKNYQRRWCKECIRREGRALRWFAKKEALLKLNNQGEENESVPNNQI